MSNDVTFFAGDFGLFTARIVEPTTRLRWLVQKRDHVPILQQMWVCKQTGETEWKTVETEFES